MKLQLLIAPLFLFSCGTAHRIQRYAQQQVLNDSALRTAHVGISVYEPATGKYLYNYQGDKYFVPASNTKIPTCYAAMKYLGDSLVGLRYDKLDGGYNISDSTGAIKYVPGEPYYYSSGTGDPTFLHPDFKTQPVFEFLKKQQTIFLAYDAFSPWFSPLGNGWSWNDYAEDYAPERSEFPIYGNVVRFRLQSDTISIEPKFFYNPRLQSLNQSLSNGSKPWLRLTRSPDSNAFYSPSSSAVYRSRQAFSSQAIPFKTIFKNKFPSDVPFENQVLVGLLREAFQKKVEAWHYFHAKPFFNKVIHSQPTDSLLRPMMHRSDNFFAEQSLLMVSNEHLNYMSDAAIIDTLLKTDFKNLPQKPRWADGSGLSRYNLFTPQDFVFILNKMKVDFGMARIKDILPTGGEGTLSSYYVSDSSFIYAKTGTLSGVVALSGFLYTQKGKELIFSILVNNHQGSATAVRRAVERFVKQLRKDL